MEWWAEAWNSVAQFFGYDEWVWGSAADWFAAIGTIAAVGVTIAVVFREANLRKRSQTDQVTVRLEYAVTWYYVVVSNRSSHPFPYVEVYWRKKGDRGRPKSAATYPDTNGDDIDAGETILLDASMPQGIEYTGTVIAVMCDAQGRMWHRVVTGDKYVSARRSAQFTRGIKFPFIERRWFRTP
ncbi:hypothetical protein [Agromyces salentinus]|uniref:DUF3592 domain-containing protein n=1 Tax=Agromyces salentinus TaxID=269421 RepID=A0ABN2MTX9_9MICO|nr:hypothetical protein [Agromyces salentinus]